MKPPAPAPLPASLAATERDTGLSKDTLRVWERRYGFPAPLRSSGGERSYPAEQVAKLRLVKRLVDAGHRPGRIVTLGLAELEQLAADVVAAPQAQGPGWPDDDLHDCLERLKSHDLAGLRRELGRACAQRGLARFVTELVAPLNTQVGDAWMRGQVAVFEEHAYTECLQALLHAAIDRLPEVRAGARPRVLLTTLPGELHGLGLLMAQALLALDGADCVPLGVATPLWDIVLAARAHRVDIVALGFSGSMGPNQVVDGLADLRARLDPAVALWAGGAAPALQRRPVPGVTAIPSLDGVADALERWRRAAPVGTRS